MKLWPLPLIILGGYGLFAPAPDPPKKDVLVIYGNIAGYLSPCGCTFPMSGGIQRFGSFIKEIRGRNGQSLTLVMPGGNVGGVGQQNEFKAECVAEAARVAGANAVALSPEDAALGPGIVLEMEQLSKEVLVSSSIETTGFKLGRESVSGGPFLVGSISPSVKIMAANLRATPVSDKLAMGELAREAQAGNSLLVVCYDGDQEQAESFARAFPEIRVLVYRSTSDPPATPEKVGQTLLVTPGFHGKDVLTLTFQQGELSGYSATSLGPDFKNDPEVSAIYSDYLRRVDGAGLLQRLPRVASGLYAGSQSCRSCHEKAFRIWASSGHAHAYKDLAAQGHGLDPDCVSCHVVGLRSKVGFKTLLSTPHLANVGCESCHGPGRSHALNPRKALLAKIAPRTCESCHTVENSPGFDFKTYWPKIAH